MAPITRMAKRRADSDIKQLAQPTPSKSRCPKRTSRHSASSASKASPVLQTSPIRGIRKSRKIQAPLRTPQVGRYVTRSKAHLDFSVAEGSGIGTQHESADTAVSVGNQCVVSTEESGPGMADPSRSAPASLGSVMVGWRAESSQVREWQEEGGRETRCPRPPLLPSASDRRILAEPSTFSSPIFRSPILPLLSPPPPPPPLFQMPGLGESSPGRPWFSAQISGVDSSSAAYAMYAVSAAGRWRQGIRSPGSNAGVSSGSFGLTPKDRYQDAGSRVSRPSIAPGGTSMDKGSTIHSISAAAGLREEEEVHSSAGNLIPSTLVEPTPRGEYQDAGTQVSIPPTESGDMDMDCRSGPPLEADDKDMEAPKTPSVPIVEHPRPLSRSGWSENRGTSEIEITELMHQLRRSVRHIAAFIAAREDVFPARESAERRIWTAIFSSM